jgi:hypothetical protein
LREKLETVRTVPKGAKNGELAPLSPATIDDYIRLIKRLALTMKVVDKNTDPHFERFDVVPWLEHCTAIVDAVRRDFSYSKSTQLKLATAVQSVCVTHNLVPVTAECKAKYTADLREFTAERNDREAVAAPVARTIEVLWNQIVGGVLKLGREDFGSDLHLILALYTLIPVRRLEYRTCRFVSEAEFAAIEPTLRNQREIGQNFCIVTLPDGVTDITQGTKIRVALYDYKTVNKLGPYKARWPSSLCGVVFANLRRRTARQGITHLVPSQTSSHFSQTGGYSGLLRRAIEAVIGKELSINDLRHIFITWMLSGRYNLPNVLLERIAFMCGHSLAKQAQYFRPNGQLPPGNILPFVLSFLNSDDLENDAAAGESPMRQAALQKLLEESNAAYQTTADEILRIVDVDEWTHEIDDTIVPGIHADDADNDGDTAMMHDAAVTNYRARAPAVVGVSSPVQLASKRAVIIQLRITLAVAEKAGITLTESDFEELAREFAWGIGGPAEPQPMET